MPPFTLHQRLLEMIDREARNALEGKRARIIAKVNAITDPEMIRALYRASCAGVRIDLIVRGICCLRPQVPRLSERIRVVSIIGRFLEHSRVYWFANGGGESEVYCASADWMERNLINRVETCFPIEDRRLARRLRRDMEVYLRDNAQSWELQPDGDYLARHPAPGEKRVASQQALMQRLAGTG